MERYYEKSVHMLNNHGIVREGFFAFFEDVNAQGDGFQLFGAVHLTALVLTVAATIGVCLLCRRLNRDRQWVLFRLIVVTVLMLELVRQFSFPLVHGHYWLKHLPLHMCGLILFIEAIHMHKPNKFTGEIIYSLGLPGAIAAMLFPDWTLYPIFHFYPLQSFVIHALHIVLAVAMLTSGNLVPSAKNLWRPAVFLLLILPPLFALNRATGTNFFFLNAGSEGSPLEVLIDIFGNPGFILPYAGILAVLWLFMYLPWHRAEKQNLKRFK